MSDRALEVREPACSAGREKRAAYERREGVADMCEIVMHQAMIE
jgi:hypothetical protein